ncbi:MAG: tetratricopeptide repeat protein [Gemmatimonadetes bacterium]|nr:tetratricopeptide repeat protein [Gemmatimonadota bacterium]
MVPAHRGSRPEAFAEHEKARELDPLTPVYTVWLAGLYEATDDDERAVLEAERALERFPDHPISLLVLGRALLKLGRHDEAIAAHERMASRNPRWQNALGITYALTGRTAEARRILNELEATPPSSWTALGLAQLHAALGDHDAALKWLEYQPTHAWWMGFVGNPLFEPLHDNPRFQALERRVSLPRPARWAASTLTWRCMLFTRLRPSAGA